MRKICLAFILSGLTALWSAPSFAVTLYDNGAPDDVSGAFSDSANSNGLEGGYNFVAYNQFTLASAATITGMEWWGIYYPGNAAPAGGDSFNYDIQSNPGGGGQPSGEITSGTLGSVDVTDTHTTLDGCEVYEYTAAPSPSIALAAGTYYLSIYDSAANDGTTFTWCTSAESAAGTEVWSYGPGYGWLDDGEYGLAFNLTGAATAAIPEPATMTLLALGLAGLIGRRIRRRRGR